MCFSRLFSINLINFFSIFSFVINLNGQLLKPNIIVFLVDDYDKPETSPYGGKVLTPNLDRLAKEGMICHNAHVTSTVCTPSRYTFLTGRYASSSHSNTLESDRMNVGRVLADAGYATGFVGKYHVHDTDHSKEGSLFGDLDVLKNAKYSDQLNKRKFKLEKLQRELIKKNGFTWAKNIYWGNLKQPFKGHNPDWTAQAALEFIEEHKDQPFYLHCCSTLLHGPNGEWFKSMMEKEHLTGEGFLKKPLGLIDRESVWKRIQKAGLTEAEVGYLWMDDSLGLILDKLDEIGIADNTIVLFVSDHGSDKKGSLIKTRGTEIPCLIRWPKVIKPGSVSRGLLQNTDFVPTWFELAKAKIPESYHIDGKSLAAMFKDPKVSIRKHIYGEQGAARAIKTKAFEYISIRYTDEQITGALSKRADRAYKTLLGLSSGISRARYFHPDIFSADQLYDLSKDPDSLNNLATDPSYAGQLKKMKNMLTKTVKNLGSRPYGDFVQGEGTSDAEASQKVLDLLAAYHAKESKKKK
jgi:arylsulfatase A-like enzyme